MLKDYTAYCIIESHYEGKKIIDHCFVPANSYAEAAKDVEDFYRGELVSVNIELIDTGLVQIPEHMIEEIMKFNFG